MDTSTSKSFQGHKLSRTLEEEGWHGWHPKTSSNIDVTTATTVDESEERVKMFGRIDEKKEEGGVVIEGERFKMVRGQRQLLEVLPQNSF